VQAGDDVTRPVQETNKLRDPGRLELKILAADGSHSLTLPIRTTPLDLGEVLGLPAGHSWSVSADGTVACFSRHQGPTLGRLGDTEQSSARLRPGQCLQLANRSLWVVDVQNPFLGTLECHSGEYQGKVWSLGFQPYRLGRSGSARANEIELNHPTVSRAQATLCPTPEGLVQITADTPTSPVCVNEHRLAVGESATVRNGDLVQLGELQFRFRQTAPEKNSYFPNDGSLPLRVGPYPITGKLGSGGMAVVYEGQAPDGEAVAIKVPLPHLLSDSEFVRRFNREMKLGTQLQHPRLTRILHFEPAGGDEYPYLVMEKLLGSTLEDIALPLPLSQALSWTGELLEALEYLHSHGVVHRDLKPANVYHTAAGLRVADLGIAHFSGTVGQRATQTGSVLGTPHYLDPSMLRGQTADARCDLYAAGLMLYQWLLGRLPYPEDPMQVFAQKLGEDLPPLGKLLPDTPPAVLSFVDRLCHPDAEQRFATAGAAREALCAL
jgi:hypothetical protein